MKTNKHLLVLWATVLMLCFVAVGAFASGFFDFGGSNGTGAYVAGSSYSYGEAKVLEKLYTRTGPSTRYEDGGSANIAGQKVKVYGWQPDENGVRWIIVDIRYGEKLRRVYTKSMYLDLGKISNQVYSSYESDRCYNIYCTVNQNVYPNYGPGRNYETHSRFLKKGTVGYYLYSENGYALVDYGTIRVWVPEKAIDY